MTKYEKLQKTLERIANWTPLESYEGLYDKLDIARLNLKHIQRYAKDALTEIAQNLPSRCEYRRNYEPYRHYARQRKFTEEMWQRVKDDGKQSSLDGFQFENWCRAVDSERAALKALDDRAD